MSDQFASDSYIYLIHIYSTITKYMLFNYILFELIVLLRQTTYYIQREKVYVFVVESTCSKRRVASLVEKKIKHWYFLKYTYVVQPHQTQIGNADFNLLQQI